VLGIAVPWSTEGPSFDASALLILVAAAGDDVEGAMVFVVVKCFGASTRVGGGMESEAVKA